MTKRREAEALAKENYIEMDPEMMHLFQTSNRIAKGKLRPANLFEF